MEILTLIFRFVYEIIYKLISIVDIKIFGDISFLSIVLTASIVTMLFRLIFHTNVHVPVFSKLNNTKQDNNDRIRQLGDIKYNHLTGEMRE